MTNPFFKPPASMFGFADAATPIELKDDGTFRLARQVAPDALEEERSGWRRWVSEADHWGGVLLNAKANGHIVIDDIDACTAWCAVNSKTPDLTVQPMRGTQRTTALRPADEKWGLICPRDWATKFCQPYFETNLAGENKDMALIEWLGVMGAVSPRILDAAAARFEKPRKNDPRLLHAEDIIRLRACAEGRRIALANETALEED